MATYIICKVELNINYKLVEMKYIILTYQKINFVRFTKLMAKWKSLKFKE